MGGKVGYLGPPGSFTHQAALGYISQSVTGDTPPTPVSSISTGTAAGRGTETESNRELTPLPTIAAVFTAVSKRSVDIGIVPVENSTNGAVYPTLDLFAGQVTRSQLLGGSTPAAVESKKEGDGEVEEDVISIGEEYVRVEHCLVAHRPLTTTSPPSSSFSPSTPPKPSSSPSSSPENNDNPYAKITSIHTHPQAWTQCSHFLAQLPPHIEKHDASSTSRAAELAALDTSGQTAAIASSVVVDIFTELHIIKRGIQDRGDNVTRFLVLKRRHQQDKTNNNNNNNTEEITDSNKRRHTTKIKSLVAFTIAHTQPGSLALALNAFNKAGLNLSSINTRPSGLEAWGYVFFVEVVASSLDSRLGGDSASRYEDVEVGGLLDQALRELEAVTGLCRWLGSWESGEVPL